jgi:hypothetical protein
MRKALLAATAIGALAGFTPAAKADFVQVGGSSLIDGNTVEMADTMMFLNSSTTPATTSSGTDLLDTIGLASTIPTGVVLGVPTFSTSGETFTTANGFATIKPGTSATDLNTMTYTPAGIDNFTSFTTRGQMADAGFNVIITVDDNLGQQFTFLEPKANQDFSPIGVEALAGTGEFITSVTVATNDPNGFNELKQETFGFDAAPVPGPIVGAGLPGIIAACSAMLGLNWKRRRRQGLVA